MCLAFLFRVSLYCISIMADYCSCSYILHRLDLCFTTRKDFFTHFELSQLLGLVILEKHKQNLTGL